MHSPFLDTLHKRWAKGAYVCVGLDSDFDKLPDSIKKKYPNPGEAITFFNKAIIDATAEYAVAYKPNSAFYEMHGEGGWSALRNTKEYLRGAYPDIPCLLDAKRGDLGNTNEAYARAVFEDLGMDALTVNPYMGGESLEPLLKRKDKGIFVMVKTSNPGSGEFQDLKVGGNGEPLYMSVARQVAEKWNTNGNCGVVVGATYPEEMNAVRRTVGELPILVPGIGAQGGDVAKTIAGGMGTHTFGLLINSSRGIIFASGGEDFADAARSAAKKLSEEITMAL